MMSTEKPLISTMILNWNRSDLLIQTLESYARTTNCAFEAFVIDNGSTDNSKQVITEFCSQDERFQSVFFKENLGGEAYNNVLELCTGSFIHLSENDLKYLPEWSTEALRVFSAFKDLGQLSLFSPVPSDDEIWELKACSLKHSGDVLMYQAAGNVGTSSVIRREIFDKGIRVHNMPTDGAFRFPDDGRLSLEIKEAGFSVAWSSRYLVRNMGHEATEIASRPDYYRENFHSKPWFRMEGFLKRKQAYEERPRPIRDFPLFSNDVCQPEISPPSSECSQPQLWSMIDSWTAELETLEFIHSLVRLIKPRFAVETGTWLGAGAVAIGKAMKRNGFGSLVSIEIDAPTYYAAQKRIEAADLDNVTLLNDSSVNYQPNQQIDFLFLDSALETREKEFRHYRKWLSPNAVIVFHDTSTRHAVVGEGIRRLVKQGLINAQSLPTPRGIVLATLPLSGSLNQRASKGAISVPLWRRAGRSLRRIAQNLFLPDESKRL